MSGPPGPAPDVDRRGLWRRRTAALLALAGVIGLGPGSSLGAAETPAPAATVSPAGLRMAPAKRVLILETYGTGFDPYSRMASTFRSDLAGAWAGPVEFFEVPLELARFDAGDEDIVFAAYMGALLSERPVDLVVAIAAPAAKFALRFRGQLFPRTPLLLFGVEQRHLVGLHLDPQTAVAPVALDLPRAVETLLAVLPDTRTLAIVIGASPPEKFWRAELARELGRFQDRVGLLFLDELPYAEMLQRVAHLPPHSAILFTIMAVDAAGVPHDTGDVLRRLSEAANAPLFGLFDTHLDAGIVGGALLPTAEVGRRATGIAGRILRGDPPALLRYPPVQAGPPVFDARQLQRWQIPESRLPPGSRVEFRPPSAWQGAFWPLVGSLLLVALETLLIVGLMVQSRRRREARAEVRALNRRLIRAGEEERRRLARELHDDLSQRLARLAIDASLLERSCPASASGAGAMREELARLGSDLHAISHRLHPSMLESLGLAEALRAESERFARTERIEVDLRLDGVQAAVPPETALGLFRVAQEAMRNVARHARASRLGLLLREVDGGVELLLADDGVGFEPARLPRGAGLGLTSMRERLQSIGGRLQIQSIPGRGTSIAAWAPLRGATA